MNQEQLIKYIKRNLKKEIKINKKKVLGRAWSETGSFVIKIYKCIAKYNYNNIMMHVKEYAPNNKFRMSSDYKGTFNFSRLIEKKLIIETSKFLKLKFSKVSGYFTTGGTEANIYSLWLARNWAESLLNTQQVEWVVPVSSHYSIKKAINILNIHNDPKHKVHIIGIDNNYIASGENIKRIIKSKRAENNDPIIIVLTAVTTEFGLLDPIEEIIKFIRNNKFVNIFIHIDACFSGLILPLFKKYENFFSYPEISTIAIDFHKTFGAPIGSGIVLVNDNYHVFSEIQASYLAANDCTLIGSRSGNNVILTWALFKFQLTNGLWKRRVRASIKLTHFLYEQFKKISYVTVIYPPFINYLIFKISGDNIKHLKKIEDVLYEYSISATLYNNEKFYKIIITDYIKPKTLVSLINKLKKEQ